MNWPEMARLACMAVLVAVLWNTWLVYPLRLLVVVFHELSHALGAWLTGGSVLRIELVSGEGGACLTHGGNRFLVLSAGYLGSLVWGGIILMAASRTRAGHAVTIFLGALLALVGLIWMRPLLGFGFAFTSASGLLLLFAGLRASLGVNDFLLKLIGLTSCLYAPLDIAGDVLARPSMPSDARMLAFETGIPTPVWGLFWFAAAVVLAGWFLSRACRAGDAAPGRQRTKSNG